MPRTPRRHPGTPGGSPGRPTRASARNLRAPSSPLHGTRGRAGACDTTAILVLRPEVSNLGDNGAMAHRVLLVEDDERIRTSMRLALEDEGYEVDEAASGEEALEAQARATASNPFDLLVVDIMLPGMDGFECCRELRRASSVPIIMVTARTDTHDVVAGLEAGADDYVTKPFEPKELAARIRALLRRARSGEPGLVQLELRRPRDPSRGRRRAPQRRGGPSHPDRVPAAVRARARTPARCSRASSCSSGSGATTTSATAASSTSTSGGCGPRSSLIRRTPPRAHRARPRLQARPVAMKVAGRPRDQQAPEPPVASAGRRSACETAP